MDIWVVIHLFGEYIKVYFWVICQVYVWDIVYYLKVMAELQEVLRSLGTGSLVLSPHCSMSMSICPL